MWTSNTMVPDVVAEVKVNRVKRKVREVTEEAGTNGSRGKQCLETGARAEVRLILGVGVSNSREKNRSDEKLPLPLQVNRARRRNQKVRRHLLSHLLLQTMLTYRWV